MPEPILDAFCHLPSHILNSTVYIFNTTSEFSFTLQWSLIKTSEPPPPPSPLPGQDNRSLCRGGVGGSLVHRALRASVCPRLLTCVLFISSHQWYVMKFFIVWLFDLMKFVIAWSQSGVKLIQKVLPRKEYRSTQRLFLYNNCLKEQILPRNF